MQATIGRRWKGAPGDLRQLKAPVVKCSIQLLSEGIPQAITLWDSEGNGIKIQSEMIDLAKRVEVGVIVLSMPRSIASGEVEIEGEKFFGKELEPLSLFVAESGHIVESGLCFRYGRGDTDELVVVAGACPYSITIRGLASSVGLGFNPEYPMDRYSRVPI